MRSRTTRKKIEVVSKDGHLIKTMPISRLFDIHLGDSRKLAATLPNDSVDVTITSPPYFDLKDYGSANQIGYGQDYDAYLSDLSKVFSQVHRATKDSGSLWIIIDTFRRDQEILPLPFDLVKKLKDVGWSLRDVIIWKKERTLPWIHEGKTKKIFEYILVLAKDGSSFRYFPDKLRDNSDLKRWWVKYPERYNPKGKALEEIWNFDIPTQGAWGKDQVRHFCPLPPSLVSRIIELTTKSQDVVLDPFAGSGTVPLQAMRLDRRFIGFELNHEYIKSFRQHLRAESGKSSVYGASDVPTEGDGFEELVTNLRILKFGRLLYKFLSKSVLSDVKFQILVRKTAGKPKEAHKICMAEYLFLLPYKSSRKVRDLCAEVDALCAVKPLSKFGISQRISIVRAGEELPAWVLKQKRLYAYTSTNSHKAHGPFEITDALRSKYCVLSAIELNVEEPDG